MSQCVCFNLFCTVCKHSLDVLPRLGVKANTFPLQGWEMCGCNTIFECSCGSAKLSSQAGKSSSRWTVKIGDLIMGGICPTMGDIEEHCDKLQAFIDTSFEDDTAERWNPQVRELLVMVLLLRWKDFVKIVSSQPSEPSQSQPPRDLSDAFHLSDGHSSNLFIGRRASSTLGQASATRHKFIDWQHNTMSGGLYW